MNSVILSTAARILSALLITASIFILLRGHNEPGGGFIGGLIAATAIAVYAISHGVAEARKAIRVDPRAMAMVGLGLALLSGLASLVAGLDPFTGLWAFFGAGEDGGKGLPISTVLLFDVGVYLVVVGAVVSIVVAMEEEQA